MGVPIPRGERRGIQWGYCQTILAQPLLSVVLRLIEIGSHFCRINQERYLDIISHERCNRNYGGTGFVILLKYQGKKTIKGL